MPGLMDVSALVGDIPTVTVTVRTFAASAIDGFGQATRGATTDVARQCVVHPATPRQLERLPEADRVRSVLAVYSTEPILTVGAVAPARIEYPVSSGRWHEWTELSDYGELGGIYFGLAALIEPGA